MEVSHYNETLSNYDSNSSNVSQLDIEQDVEVLTKAVKKPPIARNAMGEYVQHNGKPLTQLAVPLPGAADYTPSFALTKPSPPQYSIVGKPKVLAVNDSPGPNNYSTAGNMVWMDRGFPMIGKGRPKNNATCGNGPAAYKLEYGNFGSGNPKPTIGDRPAIIHGPPDKTIQPTDTHRFCTPGPAEYSPKSSLWRKNIMKSIGLYLKREKNDTDYTPGPAEYDIRRRESGPAYSLAKRLPIHSSNDNPGPGAYDIGTTIGSAVAKSITSRQPELANAMLPGPNTYSVPSRLGEAPRHSMTYRGFQRKTGPFPSPASYKPNLKNLQKFPDFSCRKVCRPIYPDILNYAEFSLMENKIVGPGTYVSHKSFSKNDAPSFSMGKRMSKKSSETPGPASYFIRQPARPDAKRSAAFSMGVRIKSKSDTVGPGPAAYYPKAETAAPRYSMSGRHRKTKASTTPAPNAYHVRTAQTNHGVFNGPNPTLKGRPSPFVYSGLRKINV